MNVATCLSRNIIHGFTICFQISKMLFSGFTSRPVEVKWLNPGGSSVFFAKHFSVMQKNPKTFKIIRLSGYVANLILTSNPTGIL